MKTGFLVLLVCFLFPACDLFMSATQKKDEGNEPPYTAKIAWNSGLKIDSYNSQLIVDGSSVYFYEESEGGGYLLTKLDAETGKLIWRSSKVLAGITYCPPIASEEHIYVFVQSKFIVCFDKETGACTAVVTVDIGNKNLELSESPALYKEYLYLNLSNRNVAYFTRLDINKISQTGDWETIQVLSPEIIWEPNNNGAVESAPVISNNIIYASTFTLGTQPLKPIEIAGFDTDTKEMVFYQTFGGANDGDVPNPESGSLWGNPIFIHDDILYYLNWSIAAWNIKTGKQLYRHVFDWNTPHAQIYSAVGSLQALFYRGKIYYTSVGYELENYRNIHCIDAATGKLVWNAIATDSDSLETNPIIAHDKLYVSQSNGFQVYDPETGELLGMDKSFNGSNDTRNILYKDYMICVRWDGDACLVAVDVSS